MDNKNKGKGKVVKEDDTTVIDTNQLKPMFTCPICNKLLDVATALTDCFHRFCWRCITRKIEMHDWRCCPVCYSDLGSHPLGKVRYDHTFDKVKQMYFPEQEERKEYFEPPTYITSSSSDSSKASSSDSNYSGASSSSSDSSEATEEEDMEDVNPSVHAKKRYKVTKE